MTPEERAKRIVFGLRYCSPEICEAWLEGKIIAHIYAAIKQAEERKHSPKAVEYPEDTGEDKYFA